MAETIDSDWVDQQRQDGLVATSVVMTVIATIIVTLRFISRFVLIRNPGLDDYFIIGALLLTIGYLIDIFILRNNHVGFPMTLLTMDNLVNFIKTTLAIQVMYYTNIFCIKTSILFTYLRFAVTPTFRYLCIGTIVLHSVFFFICFVVTLCQCRPLEKMWDIIGTAPGHCINTTAFFYTTSAFNIITDIWILVLPIKTLRAINRPRREKVALFLIFGAGWFAAASSIVRLHTIYKYTEASDPIREGILVNLWSIIEVTVAISCASVSALKPIFSSRQRRNTRVARTGSTLPSSHGRSTLSWSRWHMRLGSKDYGDKTQSHSSSGARTSDSREMTMTTAHAPPPPPTSMPRRQPVAVRPDPTSVSSAESMIAFTPMTPPNEIRRKENGENPGMSSSGSVLILQKHGNS